MITACGGVSNAPPEQMIELRAGASRALQISLPTEKVAAVEVLAAAVRTGYFMLDVNARLAAIDVPGRPHRPCLVPPHEVPKRKLATNTGRAALIHALAHIEFNAINLALDAVARFAALPEEFYRDWLTVAAEEAFHYTLLAAHLEKLGHSYGDFPAHNGLWEMALKTAADPLARMGLVPRILEARGLDVTPSIQAKLGQVGDHEAISILDIILLDEVKHVAIGNRWFQLLCDRRGRESAEMFAQLLRDYCVAPPHPPFNKEARLRAGFGAEELSKWSA